jgi:hypothetical protein
METKVTKTEKASNGSYTLLGTGVAANEQGYMAVPNLKR